MVGKTSSKLSRAERVAARRAEARKVVLAVAKEHGIEPRKFLAMAEIESRMGTLADRKGSQYKGLFQMGKNERKKYGVVNSGDLWENARGAAKKLKDNEKSFKAQMGRNPTTGEVYLMHQQGLAGAIALLKNPDKNAVEVLSKFNGKRYDSAEVVRANGGKQTMTAGQFASKWTTRADKLANGGGWNLSQGGNPTKQGLDREFVPIPTAAPTRYAPNKFDPIVSDRIPGNEDQASLLNMGKLFQVQNPMDAPNAAAAAAHSTYANKGYFPPAPSLNLFQKISNSLSSFGHAVSDSISRDPLAAAISGLFGANRARNDNGYESTRDSSRANSMAFNGAIGSGDGGGGGGGGGGSDLSSNAQRPDAYRASNYHDSTQTQSTNTNAGANRNDRQNDSSRNTKPASTNSSSDRNKGGGSGGEAGNRRDANTNKGDSTTSSGRPGGRV